MPEIKKVFVRGKMNQDLDERLVPKGEYREAQNILITNSEDSDVGAIENIQGNELALNNQEYDIFGVSFDFNVNNSYNYPSVSSISYADITVIITSSFYTRCINSGSF